MRPFLHCATCELGLCIVALSGVVPGGNQRELARQKAQAKQKEQQKKASSKDKEANKGLTLQERRERDAAALRAKMEKKQAGGEQKT
ncbi:unnamed protein product [Hymenolepis diminuta]|uniref:4F5 domain-containing protein n=1 Tax=Hymenolepis diminuta TaxID=6216 RepID=A0A0R3SC56_HYMDI|nr:unnamed protein product [Hymenolepis diminuta]